MGEITKPDNFKNEEEEWAKLPDCLVRKARHEFRLHKYLKKGDNYYYLKKKKETIKKQTL